MKLAGCSKRSVHSVNATVPPSNSYKRLPWASHKWSTPLPGGAGSAIRMSGQEEVERPTTLNAVNTMEYGWPSSASKTNEAFPAVASLRSKDVMLLPDQSLRFSVTSRSPLSASTTAVRHQRTSGLAVWTYRRIGPLQVVGGISPQMASGPHKLYSITGGVRSATSSMLVLTVSPAPLVQMTVTLVVVFSASMMALVARPYHLEAPMSRAPSSRPTPLPLCSMTRPASSDDSNSR